MQTIVLAAAKGGVGKTTLATALATAARLDTPDLRVGLVDLDPQGSLTRWWNARALPMPCFVELEGRPLVAVRRDLRASGIDLLVVDCPPGFSSLIRGAIGAADLVLVPTGASVLDLDAVAATVAMAERAGVPYRFVLNRAVFRSRIAGAAVAELHGRGHLLWPPVHQRVSIAAAMAEGRTVVETAAGSAAATEVSALWRAARGVLDGLPARRQVRHSGGELRV